MQWIWRPGAVVAVTLQPATAGDTHTVCETLAECGETYPRSGR